MEVDTSGWSGDGEFTKRLTDALRDVGLVAHVKIEDAPASREDAGFSFISNELFLRFETRPATVPRRRMGIFRTLAVVQVPAMTLEELEERLARVEAVGAADYSDEGMLQYLRTERVIPPYQTKGYKLIELVRVYEAGTRAPGTLMRTRRAAER